MLHTARNKGAESPFFARDVIRLGGLRVCHFGYLIGSDPSIGTFDGTGVEHDKEGSRGHLADEIGPVSGSLGEDVRQPLFDG